MQSFSNKVVVITGAASGIGRALAQQLSADGAHLALSDVNMAGLEDTRSSLSGAGKVTLHTLNVADRAAWQAYADSVIADHGQVDAIINNAGVALSETVENMSYDDMEWIVDINFWGVVYGTKTFLPLLKARPEAANTIINGTLKGKRRILIGADARAMDRIQRLLPIRYSDLFGWFLRKMA